MIKTTARNLHKNIEPLSNMIGKWQGEGLVQYPTMKQNVEYVEQLELEPLGEKPILRFSQKTVNKQTNTPLHVETGYLRLLPNQQVELCLAQPFGVCEILEGTWSTREDSSSVITLTSKAITRCSSAKEPFVTQTKREFILHGPQKLSYTFWMATTNTPDLTLHLTASLKQ